MHPDRECCIVFASLDEEFQKKMRENPEIAITPCPDCGGLQHISEHHKARNKACLAAGKESVHEKATVKPVSSSSREMLIKLTK